MSEFKTNKISPRKGTTQTIGDSGDTLSIPCGVTITNAGTISTAGISGGTINNSGGTISGLAGVIEWDTTAKTTAFTAVSNKGYFCNTTSAAFTVTLPASPVAGDVIALKDYANTFDTNNLTINPNGNKIQGASSNFNITVEGANSQFIYVDATRGWVLTDASKASDITEVALFTTATGGTITTCGNYKIHTFTGPGTFCVSTAGNGPTNPLGGPNVVDYLVVAGGGGSSLGGGGAGGYREGKSGCAGCYTASPLAAASGITITSTGYSITVGAGGAGQPGQTSGSNSIFSTITSAGGGKGNWYFCAGTPGGSGGGGAYNGPLQGGSGNTPPVSPPQGNNGGNGSLAADPSNAGGAGGGGGAGVSGTNGANNSPGPGGNGVTSSFNGTPTTRAGGGGAGGFANPGGSGGSGGGGPGGGGPECAGGATAGTPGTVNTGGGGGGSGRDGVGGMNCGGSGGSGIVIIRYKYQ